MELLSIAEIWKYLKWFPGFLLRRIFTKERLADLILVDIRPRHSSVSVNLGDISSFDIYFQVINMSPFEVELAGAEIEFYCAGTNLKAQHILRTIYGSGQVGLLHMQGEIESAKAIKIAQHYDKNQSSIMMHCDFNCSLHNFSKTRLHLDGVHPQFQGRLITERNTSQ